MSTIERFDATCSPEAVLCHLERLHAGEDRVERNQVSKLEGYAQNTQNVAALKRARDHGLAVHLGQDIENEMTIDLEVLEGYHLS